MTITIENLHLCPDSIYQTVLQSKIKLVAGCLLVLDQLEAGVAVLGN